METDCVLQESCFLKYSFNSNETCMLIIKGQKDLNYINRVFSAMDKVGSMGIFTGSLESV